MFDGFCLNAHAILVYKPLCVRIRICNLLNVHASECDVPQPHISIFCAPIAYKVSDTMLRNATCQSLTSEYILRPYRIQSLQYVNASECDKPQPQISVFSAP